MAALESAITGVETIELTGSSNNILRLGLLDVLNFGDNNLWNAANTKGQSGEALAAKGTRRQLRIDGNNGNQVVLGGLADWTRSTNPMTVDGNTFFDVWNHNSSAAQLLINSQVSVI